MNSESLTNVLTRRWRIVTGSKTVNSRNRMPETGASGPVGAPLEESGALPGNGLLPALGAGPFHLFRLHLDLRCDVLKKVTVTFPSEKVFSKRRPFGSQTLVVAQCRGGNLPNRRQARQNKKRRPIPRVIGSVHCIPTGSIFVSVVGRRRDRVGDRAPPNFVPSSTLS